MILNTFFSQDHVVFLEGTEKQIVLKEMISHLESLGKIKNTPRYYAQLIHRESLENTGIGSGFAIPHARTDSVQDFNVLFGVCRHGIDYQAFDGKPVRYMMLSIFPSEMSTKYLYLVGMMAKVFSSTKTKKELDEAKTPEEVYRVLNAHAQECFDSISEKEQRHYDAAVNLAGVPSSDLDLLIRIDRLYKLYDDEKSEAHLAKIKEIGKLIDNRSLTYYERMRKKCQNPFSIVEKNACSGCHMNIPPIEMNEIKERSKISICTHCGRFLIFI
jgi:mannitol/fructose-specific phosphotransferase system IIA component (Ntr-type)